LTGRRRTDWGYYRRRAGRFTSFLAGRQGGISSAFEVITLISTLIAGITIIIARTVKDSAWLADNLALG